jgi:hypothetical protein
MWWKVRAPVGTHYCASSGAEADMIVSATAVATGMLCTLATSTRAATVAVDSHVAAPAAADAAAAACAVALRCS